MDDKELLIRIDENIKHIKKEIDAFRADLRGHDARINTLEEAVSETGGKIKLLVVIFGLVGGIAGFVTNAILQKII